MKLTFAVILSAFLSSGTCLDQFEPISGELLDAWNDEAIGLNFPKVYYYPLQDLSDDGSIYEVRFGGIETGYDSLDLYLIGLSGDVPLLLATGGYRGEYNFAKSSALFDEESGLMSLYFQMPGSARYACSEYFWSMDSGTLVEIDHHTGDPSLDALEMIDILLELGEIEEAESVLLEMFYPGNYYRPEEMFCHFLRAAHAKAIELYGTGDLESAAMLFEHLPESWTVPDWDGEGLTTESYQATGLAEYMSLEEFNVIATDYRYIVKCMDD
jgi:hypothetical protein